MGLPIRSRFGEAQEGSSPGAAVHRLDNPTRLSLGMVAPRIARFHFAGQEHCSSTTSFGLDFRMRRHSGGTVQGAANAMRRLSLLGDCQFAGPGRDAVLRCNFPQLGIWDNGGTLKMSHSASFLTEFSAAARRDRSFSRALLLEPHSSPQNATRKGCGISGRDESCGWNRVAMKKR